MLTLLSRGCEGWLMILSFCPLDVVFYILSIPQLRHGRSKFYPSPRRTYAIRRMVRNDSYASSAAVYARRVGTWFNQTVAEELAKMYCRRSHSRRVDKAESDGLSLTTKARYCPEVFRNLTCRRFKGRPNGVTMLMDLIPDWAVGEKQNWRILT